MSQVRIIYHIARADFLERVRRYSFLVMLGLVVFLGYQTAIGNLTLGLGKYRGEFNSAWVGAMMSLIATFFLGWFGFYLIKGSVERDTQTGVGQIMATTPLTRSQYMLGKWLSNFAVLMSMVGILALTGLIIQFLQGENTSIDLAAFITPFLFIAAPLIALISAIVLVFEAIPFLAGGFGNIVYFFAFIISMPLFLENDTLAKYPQFEPMGLGLLADEMGRAVTKIYPDYDGSFTLGGGVVEATKTFVWTGVEWNANILFARFFILILAIGLIFVAASSFHRFDLSRTKPRRMKNAASPSEPVSDSALQALPAIHLTPLNRASNRFSFFNVLLAELKLMLKGQRWWWYLIALGLNIACFSNEPETAKQILMFAWIWHILLLSPIGNRETRDNVEQLAFSSASPLWRQLPAQWLAGFIVTLFMGSGALLNFIINGESAALISLLIGAFFIPSLALALGVWSGTSKVFEVVYVTLWYIGPLNRVPAVDFINPQGINFIIYAGLMVVLAFIGRARQLQN
jgi:hypothetical protein